MQWLSQQANMFWYVDETDFDRLDLYQAEMGVAVSTALSPDEAHLSTISQQFHQGGPLPFRHPYYLTPFSFYTKLNLISC